MRRQGLGLVLGALAALGGCSDREEAPADPAVVHLTASLVFEDGTPVPRTRRTLLGTGREAVVVRGPVRISAPVRVPAEGRLRFAVASGGDGAGCGAAVELRPGRGESVTIWRGRAAPGHDWTTASVDLGAYAGRDVTVELVAEDADSLFWGAPVVCAPGSARPNLVLYELDTLRADFLGAYGYPGGSSPTLDAVARRGVLFADCAATATWTRPSATSILTSLPAPAHGVVWEGSSLGPDAVTLAELLRDQGWYTVAFQPNPNAGRPVGLDRGFDESFEMSALIRHVQRHPERWKGSSLLSSTTASGTTELIAFLLGDLIRDWADLPLFLYVHPTDPHSPYDPRRPFSLLPATEKVAGKAALQEDLAAYVRDVRASDHFLAAILRRLESEGALRRTIFAFLSDHGEEFGERGGRGHGQNLHDETLRVPLVVRAPELADGRVVRRRVSTLDLLPTLTGLLGASPPPGIQGRSLLPLPPAPGAGGVDSGGTLFAHVVAIRARMRDGAADNPELVGDVAALEGRWKCIIRDYGRRRSPLPQLFDLLEDPGETVDVAEEHPEVTERLAAAARDWFDREKSGGHDARAEELDPELQEQLRALGYAN
jgi:arylsulfatase A-like enzyme